MEKSNVINLNQGKIPPQAVDIEEGVISALLIDDKAAIEAMPLLKSVDIFYKEKHQHIFQAIQKLYHKSESIDMLTVAQELKKAGTLEAIGGEYELIQLTQVASSSAHIEHHCRILLQQWVRRAMIKKSNKLIEMAYDDRVDVFDLLDYDNASGNDVQEIMITGNREIVYADVLDDVVKRVELLTNKEEGDITGITTGFKKIDAFTGGWQPSDLVILAARPGMGKTSLILKNVVECGLQGVSVGIISLEMSAQQLATRTVAINSNFHLTQLLRDGFEKSSYFTTLVSKVHGMKKFKIHINDTASMDIKDIIAQARLWKRKHNIGILFVDYIQLATDKSKSNNREQEIASISRSLKKIAKELDIPVIALSQLSRKVEERGGEKRPKLADIRESGAIEQDADIVTFIYRPEYYGLEVTEDLLQMNANTELIFAKYRNGSLETKGLYFETNKAKFMDPEQHHQHQPDHFI